MMNTNKLKSLIIVGGGSAGWITALYLQQYFNQRQQHINITVLESEHQGPIGVGEATVHSIRFLFSALGLDESELMQRTNATLKLGILFRNWMQPSAGKQHEYFHPFEQQNMQGNYDLASEWMIGEHYRHQRYDQGVCLSSLLAQIERSPKTSQHNHYQGFLPYAYHLDAVLLGQYLREKGIERGIKHGFETVTEVHCDAGKIKSITTNVGQHQADFFVDCSGFKGLLINALKQDNWLSFKRELPCDKAVAIQTDYPSGYTPKPYTTATALDNGWAWQIDLVNRRGNGYVYDSDKITPEAAEQELRAFLGPASSDRKALHLDMHVGRRKECWVGNCVAIGLSAGFIEPLESTGLHLINVGARLFATHYSNQHTTQSLRDSYNKSMAGVFEDLKQFIVLHYCLTNRTDTAFWQQAGDSAKLQPDLAEKLTLWKHKICEFMDLAGGYSTTFNDENYRYVLYGMQHYPNLHLDVDSQSNQQLFYAVKHKARELSARTIPHSMFLEALHQKPLFEDAKPHLPGGSNV